jgi:plasmid stabilization system protein ParE
MPPGDKSSYTEKQKRTAEHIEESYKDRGVSKEEAERRAWATVNATDHGGKKSGSRRGKKRNPKPSKKGGHLGRATSAARPGAERSASAKWPLEDAMARNKTRVRDFLSNCGASEHRRRTCE